MWLSDSQKIGVGLTVSGILFMFLGVILFFDGGLLAIGNILFLAGLLLGTIMFFGGILMVFFKWPIIGMCIEIFGFVNLFGDFFPVVLSFMRKLPIVGNVLNLPVVSKILDSVVGSKLPV
ncbi:hypothetical protein BC829DRAFT_409968 [Chytridium lagenaria]|nr:hypothetical protein BC829DRAFT_409968 [Chytridium lagenaria]